MKDVKGKKIFISSLVVTLGFFIGGFFILNQTHFKNKNVESATRTIISNIKIYRNDVLEATKNLSKLLAQAKLSPLYSFDGRVVNGFQIDHIEPNSIYQKMGFKEGDKILNINNQKLFTPDKTMEIYNILTQSANVQMGIERQGTLITLNFIVE